MNGCNCMTRVKCAMRDPLPKNQRVLWLNGADISTSGLRIKELCIFSAFILRILFHLYVKLQQKYIYYSLCKCKAIPVTGRRGLHIV
jgi:hypothetical protein